MLETLVFWFFLVIGAVIALAMFGVNFRALAHVKWVIVLRVILAIVAGFAFCAAMSAIGLVAGVIGLVGGIILGAFLPSIISFAWRVSKWYLKLMFVTVIVLALVAAAVS